MWTEKREWRVQEIATDQYTCQSIYAVDYANAMHELYLSLGDAFEYYRLVPVLIDPTCDDECHMCDRITCMERREECVRY